MVFPSHDPLNTFQQSAGCSASYTIYIELVFSRQFQKPNLSATFVVLVQIIRLLHQTVVLFRFYYRTPGKCLHTLTFIFYKCKNVMDYTNRPLLNQFGYLHMIYFSWSGPVIVLCHPSGIAFSYHTLIMRWSVAFLNVEPGFFINSVGIPSSPGFLHYSFYNSNNSTNVSVHARALPQTINFLSLLSDLETFIFCFAHNFFQITLQVL